MLRALLGRPRLSVISGEPDRELDRLGAVISLGVRVAGRRELEALLRALIAEAEAGAPVAPKTLDLVGHATARGSLLRLGDWVLDASQPAVASWLCELAARGVLPRVGVTGVRLLACGSATAPEGRATICAMADLLGLEVSGATQLLYDAHYDAGGFRDAWAFLLVSAGALRRAARGRDEAAAPRGPHHLTLEGLPQLPEPPASAAWPTRRASPEHARQLLRRVRAGSGAPMPAAPPPSCAVVWPAPSGTGYQVAHVLFEGAFLQVFPDGLAAPGVAFAVDEPRALWRSLAALPLTGVTR